MTTKLKNLSVTSVDLVDQGANPDAYVRLFKRKDAEPEKDPDAGLFRKFMVWMEKGLRGAMYQNDSYGNMVENKKEETDTMKIDKSKMTSEEKAALEALEKKYGVDDGAQGAAEADGGAARDGDVGKGVEPQAQESTSAELHPDVQKALSDYRALMKRQSEEMEELRKSLEIERLTAAARKYEVLGKKAPELAEKLYALKKAGGTVYDDYVALLDENVVMLEKSGLFSEIGKNTQGGAGTEQSLGIKAAELSKSAAGGMTSADAMVKAFEENPELAAQYEAEYRGGM